MAAGLVAGAIVGWAASSTAGSVWGAYVAPYFDPITARNRYVAWENDPCLCPEPTQLMDAWRKGFITSQVVPSWMQAYGIRLPDDWANNPGNPGMNPYQSVWTRICQSMETPVPVEIAVRKYQLGDMTPEEVRKHLRLAGFGKADTRNQIIDRREVPDPGETLTLLNRGKITVGESERYFRANGYTDNTEISLLSGLRYAIPGPSDLIMFAVREVWDNAVVDRFQYDAEFPASFQLWMDKQGSGWKPSDAGFAVPPGQDITWPQAYWRAHWQVMGPGQAGDALYRLRPRAPGDPQSRIDGIPAFTTADYDLMMRIADYPPIVRQWFQGLASQPLPLRSIQQLYNNGLIPLDEVKEAFKDQAYSDINATRMRDLVHSRYWASQTSKTRAQLASTARKGFLEGWMTADEAATFLYKSMVINPSVWDRLNGMNGPELTAEANADTVVQAELAALRLQAQETLANLTIAAVKKSALRREITSAQATALLAAAGIQPGPITEYIRQWNLQLLARGKNASAAQALAWYKRGILTDGETTQRLLAEGYNSTDVRAMLAAALQDVALQQQKLAEKTARTQQQRLRAQQQQLKQQDQNRRRIVADLSRSASRAGILAFLKDGLISQVEAKQALVNRGILPGDADLWIADALKGSTNGTKKTTTPQPAGQGQGQSPPGQATGGNP